MNKKNVTRRHLLASAAGIASIAAGVPVFSQDARPAMKFDNADFYTNGRFDENKAKDAIVELCRYHGYPMFPKFKERLWISDYGIGRFAEVGLACVGFVNHVAGESSFMLQDLFLLPGQMLPEHWHIKPEKTPNCAQKDEGWLIRWGRSYVVGIGEPNLPPEVVVPKSHWDGRVETKHCTVADPGDYVQLTKVGSKHWQMAGKNGVILTEVANAHDNASVRHSDPIANKTFLDG